MNPLKTDLSIFKKLNLEKPPVGVKFLFHKPEGIEPLNESLGLCEMLSEAQARVKAFYFTKENENCFGKAALGMIGVDVGRPRRPLTELSEANRRTLRLTLERLGVLREDSYQREFFSRR